MMDRLLLALGLSLVLHLPLVLMFGWPATPLGTRQMASAPNGGSLSVRVDWGRPSPRRAPRVVPKEEYIKADVGPVVTQSPVISPVGPIDGGTQGTPVAPSRGAPSGGGSGGTGVGLLSAPATVRRVVYLVDRSASMGPSGGLERALKELQDALKSLPPDASFQVLFYNQGTQPLLPPTASGLVPASPGAIDQALARLDDIRATGITNHLAAFQAALYLRPDVLFLVTDADDLTPPHVRSITSINRARSRIHVIELCRSAAANTPLADLARLNAGTYRRVAP